MVIATVNLQPVQSLLIMANLDQPTADAAISDVERPMTNPAGADFN
jgi:hypothetical protein